MKRSRQPPLVLRTARASEAAKLLALVDASRAEGHLLPRSLDDLQRHAARFVVAARGRSIVGCGELAPLSLHVAEVRSLAVGPAERGRGVGTRIVDELRERARRAGFEKLCAFTHAPAYFIAMGFSIVPHLWVPEKVRTDCVKCPRFRQCGQHAMLVPVKPASAIEMPATGVSISVAHA